MLIECACCKKETEHQHLHNCAHGIPDLEKTHYETTYDRVQRLESQLAEARAEVERLTERLQANAAKIDEEDVVIEWADYLELKAEARQEAAREIIALMGGWSLQNSTLITCRGIVARHFGLEV